MLLSKEVEMRWNGTIKKWYIDKGYKYTKHNEVFICKVDDLMEGSTVNVSVVCDYCGKEFLKTYRRYIKGHKYIITDCCSDKKCVSQKTSETNMINFGVKNNNQREEVKIKSNMTRKISKDNLVIGFEEKGLVLLSDYSEYKNDRSRLKYICTKHKDKGIQETNYANIKSQKHCCKYGAIEHTTNMSRNDGVRVYNEFVKSGFTPMFKPEDYKKNDSPLPFICPKHIENGVQYRTYESLKVSKGCYFCSKERVKNALKSDINVVINEFNKKNLTLLSKNYNNKDELLDYECNAHKGIVQKLRFGSLKNTQCPCVYCREEKHLTKISRSVRSSLGWWRCASKKVSDNNCILTGLKKNTEIHHQYQLDTIIKESLIELNMEIRDSYCGEDIVLIKEKVNEIHKKHPLGVCMNKTLHTLFHSKYGKRDCDKNKFNKFIKEYFNGEYDSILDNKLKSINSKMSLEEVINLTSFYYVEN